MEENYPKCENVPLGSICAGKKSNTDCININKCNINTENNYLKFCGTMDENNNFYLNSWESNLPEEGIVSSKQVRSEQQPNLKFVINAEPKNPAIYFINNSYFSDPNAPELYKSQTNYKFKFSASIANLTDKDLNIPIYVSTRYDCQNCNSRVSIPNGQTQIITNDLPYQQGTMCERKSPGPLQLL